MKMSLQGLRFLLAEEAIALDAYRDTAGVWTIGVGHTASAGGMAPRKGDRITMDRALAMFAEDIAKYEDRVSHAIKRPLKQHEFDALVSFDFNTGKINAGTVDDKLNAGDRIGAMKTLALYINGGAGLGARRGREVDLFADGIYPSRDVRVIDGGKSRFVKATSIVIPTVAVTPPPPDIEPPIGTKPVTRNMLGPILAGMGVIVAFILSLIFGGN